MEICKQYVGIECIDGSCPMANAEEYEERCMDVVRHCSECWHLASAKCEDCYFYGTVDCFRS